MSERIKVSQDGAIRLPDEIREQLGWHGGSFLHLEVGENSITLRKIEVDLFKEATKAPDLDAFDKAIDKQERSREDAFREFEERMKNPPELRPEDRPDFWD